MQFNGKELTAIAKMAKAMTFADGKVDPNEMKVMALEFIRFGVPQTDLELILNAADAMDSDEAIRIISSFDTERKKYVAAYLGLIMVADKNVDEKELALWKLISTLCSLPTMSIGDALDFMKNL